MLENQLEKLGFAKNEIAVYLALFELGKTRAGEIIQHTRLHRNLVYQSLERLIERQLISKVISKGVAVFEANSPDVLISLIEEQKSIAEQVSKELKKKREEKPREIVVYEGDEGIKRSRSRALQYHQGDTLYVIGSKASSSPEMEKYWRQFHKKREAKGVGLKLLYEHGVDPKDVEWRNQLAHSEAKYLPFNMDLPVWFAFIKDYLEIGIAGDNPLTFGITSGEAVGAFENFFRYFWNQKVSTFEGDQGFNQAFGDILQTLQKGEELLIMGIFDFDSEFAQMIAQFHTQRSQKGIKAKILLNENAYKLGGILQHLPYTNIQYMQKGMVTPAVFLLYKNKTLISMPNQRTFMCIEDAEATESFRSYFHNLWQQETQILRGPEVVKNIWLESIELGEIRLIGARGYFIDRYPHLFAEVKRAAEKRKGLKWKNIVDPSARNHPLNKFPWTEARYNIIGSKNPNVVWLWGNKVAIANWTEDEPVVFISENRHLVQSYNDYFEELWNLKK